ATVAPAQDARFHPRRCGDQQEDPMSRSASMYPRMRCLVGDVQAFKNEPALCTKLVRRPSHENFPVVLCSSLGAAFIFSLASSLRWLRKFRIVRAASMAREP